MKTSDVTTYNSLVDHANQMKPSSKHRMMVVTLLNAIRSLIMGEYSKVGFEKASGININWKYFCTIRDAWLEIKHAKNPKAKLVACATSGIIASFH